MKKRRDAVAAFKEANKEFFHLLSYQQGQFLDSVIQDEVEMEDFIVLLNAEQSRAMQQWALKLAQLLEATAEAKALLDADEPAIV